ncbi:hypothetical protein DRN86_05570 [Candidatus Geothermarchaeota archaeon]|nr:MAG: hypothetical protein DRN86_05570 [Candidatus Geothermarchaeota archaeon]
MKVLIDDLIKGERFIKVISYPKGDLAYAKDIVEQLKLLKIAYICFEGEKKIDNLRILGKGTTSIVLKAIKDDGTVVAVKILRSDANRVSLMEEAKMLKMANDVGVGPKLIGITKRVLVMEYVIGKPILEVLKEIFMRRDTNKLLELIKDLLLQAFKLDRIGLDHGELSHADKHIYFSEKDGKAIIIDFESASSKRRPSNLTSLFQYLVIRNPYSGHVREVLGLKDLSYIFKLLRRYKKEISKKNFDLIMRELALVNSFKT